MPTRKNFGNRITEVEKGQREDNVRQKEENMFSSLENTFSSLCLGARGQVWAPVGVAKVMVAGAGETSSTGACMQTLQQDSR